MKSKEFKKIELRMKDIGNVLNSPDAFSGFGYILTVFELENDGMLTFVSNVDREDLIEALKKTIKELESGATYDIDQRN